MYDPTRSSDERMNLHMPESDFDYALLRQISDQPSASQRSLASRLGVSVGKVNYCLHALVDRGWIKVGNFKRSDNKWAYTYLLTPRGAVAKLKLAHDFLEFKEREFERLQAELVALRNELARKSPEALNEPDF